MRLDKLALALRPRSNWEGVDLGLRMIQAWWRPFYGAWLPVYLVLAGIPVLVIGYGLESPNLAALVTWWLKPLYDRVALHVLARAVFGELVDWRQTWRVLPSIIGHGALWRRLTWARLSPYRSLLLPVDQLEGLRGKAARDRRQLLTRQVGGTALWLTWTMAHFELIFLAALVGLVMLALPEAMAERIDVLNVILGRDDTGAFAGLLFLLADLVIVAFVEPFYVACGFALYLKRRTDLEAWDVELSLRRLRDVPTPVTGSIAAIVAMLSLTLLLVGVAVPSPLYAADPIAARAKPAIEEILKRPEFGEEQSIWRLKYVGPKRDQEVNPHWLRAIAKAFKLIGQWIASVGRVLGWALLALFVVVLVYIVYRQWRLRRAAPGTFAPPAEVAGFDIRPESLPEDIARESLRLARAGQTRACLSLLYRAALSALVHRHHVPFTRGDTEGDCLRRVRVSAQPRYLFFATLTAAWQEIAYAHHSLPPDRLEALCLQWPNHFDANS